ncbi:MAG: Stp1/IreP family PP2C-type Ser/Thr phosphatase [Chloroflexota bacterium]|jgi:hypothetical protein|nr:Stp1/IreP family PP2C-type Ser/Thr phosphatase [Chloroflexota bacterium]
MAARLQLKLGLVAEHDRLDDSPDTLLVVEPSVGSVARSKGHLYLLVTSRVSSRHALEATRLAAETIRNEYYYDESAGIRVCLKKAIATANKRLIHQADRLGLKSADGNGPIGVGVAVVRGNEMYVATVGPAEAYLIRQARLSTLPDPHRERGLPSDGLEPDVWRGEITVGDSLVLTSPNIVARLGADELKDAMLTLHPQSAMEHLHARFRAADGSGSDGAIAFEATEVAPTTRGRTLVPVRPAEPLAGAPDRSPIPLADNVQAASAAMSAAAGTARVAAGGAFDRLIARAHDFMPQRKPAYRRVTPLASRRETQRRAAVAILALVMVVGGLGLGVYAFGGQGQQRAISSVNAGQAALDIAKANLAKVSGPGGIDLVADDPEQALDLLTAAYTELDNAEEARVSARVIDPIRADVVAGLDRLYGVVDVESSTMFNFKPAEGKPAFDIKALVRGPDGAPYVIDGTTNTVIRIDLKRKRATGVFREGAKAGSTTLAAPRFLAVGGRDLLILDAKNVLWRWRASNDAGKGRLNKVDVNGSTQWGDDITAMGTYLRDVDRGLANLYVVDPSEEQIRVYFAALDGSGYPAKATGWLATARDVSQMTAMYIDGDMFVVEGGVLERFASGKSDGWEPGELPDALLREQPNASLVTGQGERREGTVFTYDREHSRLVEYEKASGDYLRQYRLAAGAEGWGDMRGMYVLPGVEDGPPAVYWVSPTSFNKAFLEQIVDEATPSGSPGPGSGASEEPSTAPSTTP